MLKKIKVFLIRKFYRLQSAFAWRGYKNKKPYLNLQVPTVTGHVNLRSYPGEQGSDLPLIVYFHGGGWVIGDLDTHQPFCRVLCQRSGCTVVSVDYRLAPEHPYPAAHNDCLEVSTWIAAHLEQVGPSNGKMVLAGDSAGANLATATCLALEPAVCQRVLGEIVIYPVTDHYEQNFPSYSEKARGHKLTRNLMIWFWDTYLASMGPSAASDPQLFRAMPLKSSALGSLPATFLVTAEHDPLRDEGVAYAVKLRNAGVAVACHHFNDARHGFACSEGLTEDFDVFMSALVDWLHRLT